MIVIEVKSEKHDTDGWKWKWKHVNL